MQFLHIQRIIIIAGAILPIISLFLPWYKYSYLFSDYTQSGFNSDGWISLVIILIILVLSFVGDNESAISKLFKFIIMGLFIINASFGIYKYYNPENFFKTSTFITGLLETYQGASYGIFIFITVNLISAVVIMLLKTEEKKYINHEVVP